MYLGAVIAPLVKDAAYYQRTYGILPGEYEMLKAAGRLPAGGGLMQAQPGPTHVSGDPNMKTRPGYYVTILDHGDGTAEYVEAPLPLDILGDGNFLREKEFWTFVAVAATAGAASVALAPAAAAAGGAGAGAGVVGTGISTASAVGSGAAIATGIPTITIVGSTGLGLTAAQLAVAGAVATGGAVAASNAAATSASTASTASNPVVVEPAMPQIVVTGNVTPGLLLTPAELATAGAVASAAAVTVSPSSATSNTTNNPQNRPTTTNDILGIANNVVKLVGGVASLTGVLSGDGSGSGGTGRIVSGNGSGGGLRTVVGTDGVTVTLNPDGTIYNGGGNGGGYWANYGGGYGYGDTAISTNTMMMAAAAFGAVFLLSRNRKK